MPTKLTTTTTAAAAAKDDEIDRRAIEAIDDLGIPREMRQAVAELVATYSYEDAARKAGTTPEIVRGWTLDPAFVMAVGWFVIGLADNQ
jgi:hypothetical protein